ncbi:MAG: hypothetical protein ACNA7H_11435, partial [Desulfotignum sp.]
MSLALGLPACTADTPAPPPAVSGFLQDGLRVIPVLPSATDIHLTVYRGDYIKFQTDPSLVALVLSIPELDIRQALPAD